MSTNTASTASATLAPTVANQFDLIEEVRLALPALFRQSWQRFVLPPATHPDPSFSEYKELNVAGGTLLLTTKISQDPAAAVLSEELPEYGPSALLQEALDDPFYLDLVQGFGVKFETVRTIRFDNKAHSLRLRVEVAFVDAPDSNQSEQLVEWGLESGWVPTED